MDLAAFQELSRDLKVLNERRSKLVSERSQLSHQQLAVSKELKAVGRNRQRAQALNAEKKQLAAAETHCREQIQGLDKQLEALKIKLAHYPSSDHYVLDCFALDTGQETDGARVLDHGSVL